MWKKADMKREIKAKLAEIDEQRRRDTKDHGEIYASVTYANEKECRGALLWLAGKNAPMDFKVESRQRDGVWTHRLLYGAAGYSAANELIKITG